MADNTDYVTLSLFNCRTNKENALTIGLNYINLSPDFQRSYEAWDDKLRTRLIESILLNRATNPIWTVYNEDENSEEVLDGKHRGITAKEYFNNGFAIDGKYLLSLNSEKYNKKKFEDLDNDDKNKIRNYKFTFNKLDSTYRKDLNKLRDMYELLNRSSVPLNIYEFQKVTLGSFYNIIAKHKDEFKSNKLFKKKKDIRGSLDIILIEMVCLADILPNGWSSITTLKDTWVKKNMGESIESVNDYNKTSGDEIENKLKFMLKIINDFNELGLFSDDTKTFNTQFVPYKFMISRCCFLIKKYSLFNRMAENITTNFKKIVVPIVENTKNRNAVFQKNIIEKIDEIIKREFPIEKNRCFSPKMIKDKLLEQKNICPKCNKLITENYEGDHVIPWTAGGETVIENLQVLHTRCHQLK